MAEFSSLWCMQSMAKFEIHVFHVVDTGYRLQQLFPNRVIGLTQAVEWPPWSPDLTPLDIFIWGYFRVYKTVPAQLKSGNQSAFEQPVELCIAAQGLQVRKMPENA